jgi:hypothetical protein
VRVVGGCSQWIMQPDAVIACGHLDASCPSPDFEGGEGWDGMGWARGDSMAPGTARRNNRSYPGAIPCPDAVGAREVRTAWNGQLFAKQVMPFVDMTVKGE